MMSLNFAGKLATNSEGAETLHDVCERLATRQNVTFYFCTTTAIIVLLCISYRICQFVRRHFMICSSIFLWHLRVVSLWLKILSTF